MWKSFRIFVLIIMGVDINNTRQMHLVAELHTNNDGEYYVVTVRHSDVPTTIRQTYQPFGWKLQYPKKWGRKRGALELLNHKIEDQKRIINNATIELNKLNTCLTQTQNWSDD